MLIKTRSRAAPVQRKHTAGEGTYVTKEAASRIKGAERVQRSGCRSLVLSPPREGHSVPRSGSEGPIGTSGGGVRGAEGWGGLCSSEKGPQVNGAHLPTRPPAQ